MRRQELLLEDARKQQRQMEQRMQLQMQQQQQQMQQQFGQILSALDGAPKQEIEMQPTPPRGAYHAEMTQVEQGSV